MDRLGLEQLEEVRARLAQRPPDAAFTAAEAAIYTGRSTRTLKRAIDAGVGPRREKNPDVSGLGATNRHTRYRKADLDAWRESLVAFAIGFRDFGDLTLDAPWVIDGEAIVCHLLDLDDIDNVLEALGSDKVVFLKLHQALWQVWTNAVLRRNYREAFERLCQTAMGMALDAEQRDALEKATAAALGDPSEPMRP